MSKTHSKNEVITMNKLTRSTTTLWLACFAAAAMLTSGGAAFAEEGKASSDEPAIKLGSEQLGLSREELGTDKVVDTEQEKAEKKGTKAGKKIKARHQLRKHSGKDKKHGKHGKHECSEHECGETCKARHKGKRRYNYKSCVEAAVRAENNLDESSRVCRALFPKKDS